MTDLEISRALALAIGWSPHDLFRTGEGVVCYMLERHPAGHKVWDYRTFDYRDWNVIGPIAERYAAFPSMIADGNYRKHKAQGYATAKGWEVFITDYRKGTEQNAKWDHYVADTPQKVIAMAVIGAKR